MTFLFGISATVENNLLSSANYDDRGGTLTTNFQYTEEFENNLYGPHFERNAHVRSSSAGGTSIPSSVPLRTLNNNHYANLQVEDPITCNIQRQEDKKSLFKVPFPTSFKGTKNNGCHDIKNGAGPLTKPPPSFLQPKSRYASNIGTDLQSQQPLYQDYSMQHIQYQGKNSTNA